VGRITASPDPESGLDRYTGAVLVAEWMTRDPITHAPEDSMGQAAETMSRRQIRRIPVIEHGAVIGIVAKSDVLNACPADFNPFSAEAQGLPLTSLRTPLRQIMTPRPLTVAPDLPIETAAQLMVEHKIGGLPVVTDHLVGILTQSDLFRALTAALGSRGPGLRLTFDVSQDEDPVRLIIDLAGRHSLLLASVSTYERDGRRVAIVRLLGTTCPELVEDLWKTGHRVLSVLRMT
jgi:acetoin utilization protein AcuB